jgi:hypothetical protein
VTHRRDKQTHIKVQIFALVGGGILLRACTHYAQLSGSPDIEERVEVYVQSLARPRVTGVSTGRRLDVRWPMTDATSLLAILMPDKVTEVILAEIERAANLPMPPEGRRKRMGELRRQIDTLQRQAVALGADTRDLPAEVVLGVRVVHCEQGKRVERRERAA